MPRDDFYWAMFDRYVFVTVSQAQQILSIPRDSVDWRLRRFAEEGLLGRVQINRFTDYLYFLSARGAQKAYQRGCMKHPNFVQRKSKMHIDHEKGITNFQHKLYTSFPEAETKRWRGALEKEFVGEIPDLLLDLHDGVGWCPFEFVRENPLTDQKLRDYTTNFARTYVLMETENAVQNFLELKEDLFPVTNLWFTDEVTLSNKGITGKIWWTPKNYEERQYSILKPES